MRVALLSRAAYPLHDPGGLERAVFHLAKHLAAQGVEATLFTRPATRPGVFPCEVVEVPYGATRGLPHGRVLDRTLHYPAFARRLGMAVAEEVRRGRVDVVHAQGLAALGYGRLRGRDTALRAPLVMNPQGMEEHKAGGLKSLALARIKRLSREAARHADRVIATDEATRDEVPRYLGVDPGKVVVLPNGVDVGEIRESTPPDWKRVARQALPILKTAHPVFLSVGRIEAYKGFGDILAAFELLEETGRLPRSWAWVVVGEGRYTPALERRRRHGIAKHLSFAGRVSETLLHALYERADVFVHATRYEGSSLVTLEAMAHRLPVVATRAGGIPDKVDALTGRLVEPGDVAGLAGAIAELASEAGLRRRLGAAGRARVVEGFTWERVARETVRLYEELLAR
ncbi:MAG TPA: glycosyltransferase family 4 protein [Vicinamibacteria bacterium]|nr:glycosyltransferase family 4 protein [Vicinamibacteria bacterium]